MENNLSLDNKSQDIFRKWKVSEFTATRLRSLDWREMISDANLDRKEGRVLDIICK